MNCAACNLQTTRRDQIILCATCKETYHYKCLNMTPEHYMEIKNSLIKTWNCPTCTRATRQPRNDDTPIRHQHIYLTHDETTMSIDDQICEDLSLIGDTPNIEKTYTEPICSHSNYSDILQKFSQILDDKLEKNKEIILKEMKTTFELETTKKIEQIRREMIQKNDKLEKEQINTNKNIEQISIQIEKLMTENTILKQEIRNLQTEINKHKITEQVDIDKTEHSRTIVFYGFTERHAETERDLEDRLIYAINDILGVDLTGYVEEIFRIGKRGARRPIHVELISKKMTRYILNHAKYFKATGLYVSEYLDRAKLLERRQRRGTLNKTHYTETRLKPTQNMPLSRPEAMQPNTYSQAAKTSKSDLPQNTQTHKNQEETVTFRV